MSSIFDPNALLDATLDQPSVRRPPLPVGDYTAVVGEVSAQPWQSKDGAKSGVKWNVPLTIQVPMEVQQSLGIEQPTVTLTHGLMLDLTAQGGLDNSPGKNRGIRQYREALDMNKPGDSFSARKMQGQVVLVKVTHREYQGEIMEDIGGVAKAV